MYFIYLKMKVIIAVINTTKALVKIKLEKKKFRLVPFVF